MSIGRFGGVYAALHVGHTIGDYWVQTNHQAATKGQPGWDGRLACAVHVATLTAVQAATFGAVMAVSGDRVSWRRAAAGLAVNAASHYVADRRRPLGRLAARTGKQEFWDRPDGRRALDQAWHNGWNGVAAAIIAARG
jgi:hypothetical protein